MDSGKGNTAVTRDSFRQFDLGGIIYSKLLSLCLIHARTVTVRTLSSLCQGGASFIYSHLNFSNEVAKFIFSTGNYCHVGE